jgi:hypothetical protein
VAEGEVDVADESADGHGADSTIRANSGATGRGPLRAHDGGEASHAETDLGEGILGRASLEAGDAATSPEALLLADAYQQHGILTPKFYADGIHIVLATIAEVDLLVSWSFRHIVRYDKIRLFAAVNLEVGYKPLAIYSVETMRSIRDAKYGQLRGKSPEERIAFYRAKARLLQAQVATRRQERPADDLRSA